VIKVYIKKQVRGEKNGKNIDYKTPNEGKEP
jgi:hypothetical protein